MAVLSAQEMPFGEAISNAGQHGNYGKPQPQQLHNQPLLPKGSNQLLMPHLPMDRALSSLQQLKPQTASPAFVDQQLLLQNAVQQVQALCQTIGAPWLDSGLAKIDASKMLSQQGAIENMARIANNVVQRACVQHPSSSPAQRCQEVCSRPHACAATHSVMLTRWYRHDNSMNAAEAI